MDRNHLITYSATIQKEEVIYFIQKEKIPRSSR